MNKFNEDRKSHKHQSHLLKCNYDIVSERKHGGPAHEEVVLTGGSVPQKAAGLNPEVKSHLNVRNEVFQTIRV